MTRTRMSALLIFAGVFLVSCAENNGSDENQDTTHTQITDTVSVPTQGYNPDMSTIHVPDTMPQKDSMP